MEQVQQADRSSFRASLWTALLAYVPLTLLFILALTPETLFKDHPKGFWFWVVFGPFGVNVFLLAACLVPARNRARRARRGAADASAGWGQGFLNAVGDTLGQCLCIAFGFAVWAAMIGTMNRPGFAGGLNWLSQIAPFGLILGVIALPAFLYVNLLRLPIMRIHSSLNRIVCGILGLSVLLFLAVMVTRMMTAHDEKMGVYVVQTLCMLSAVTFLATIAGDRALD